MGMLTLSGIHCHPGVLLSHPSPFISSFCPSSYSILYAQELTLRLTSLSLILLSRLAPVPFLEQCPSDRWALDKSSSEPTDSLLSLQCYRTPPTITITTSQIRPDQTNDNKGLLMMTGYTDIFLKKVDRTNRHKSVTLNEKRQEEQTYERTSLPVSH